MGLEYILCNYHVNIKYFESFILNTFVIFVKNTENYKYHKTMIIVFILWL